MADKSVRINEDEDATWSYALALLVVEDLLKSDILSPYQFAQARIMINCNILAYLNHDCYPDGDGEF